MKRYYECHVTFTGPGHAPLDESGKLRGWKFSRIDGDPVLGAGVKCYLTKHYRETSLVSDIIERMREVAADLRRQGYQVLRLKVELVIFDDRTQR